MIIRSLFKCLSLSIFISFGIQAQKVYTASEIKEDMDYLKQRLEKLHPGLYRYQDSTDYQNFYKRHCEKLEYGYQEPDAFKEISPLITRIKDLHTGIYPSKSWLKKNNKRIPLYMDKYDGKYFVSYSCARDSNIIRGTEIRHIGGQSVDSLWHLVSKLYSPDNGNKESAFYFSTFRFFRLLKYVQMMPDSIQVGFRSLDDSTWNTWLKPLKAKEFNKILLRKYPDAIRRNFSYKMMDSTHKVAKLDITSFKEKGPFWDTNQGVFKRKLKKVMARVEADSVEHLVLDFRGNGGGAISNIPRVIQYFSSSPFEISKRWSIKKTAFAKAFPVYRPLMYVMGLVYFNGKMNNMKVRDGAKMTTYKPAKKYGFKGDLYIFGNGGSYSATTFTSSILLDRGLATYIGSTAGGAKWGSYAGRWYTGKLPNTKFRFRIPFYKIEHALYNTNEDFFIEPDYRVASSFSQFLKKENASEKFLLDLVRTHEK